MEANRLMSGMSREDKVILYVIGAADKLREKGLVEGGQFRLCEKGHVSYEALVASGFQPTKAEIDAAMIALCEQ